MSDPIISSKTLYAHLSQKFLESHIQKQIQDLLLQTDFKRLLKFNGTLINSYQFKPLLVNQTALQTDSQADMVTILVPTGLGKNPIKYQEVVKHLKPKLQVLLNHRKKYCISPAYENCTIVNITGKNFKFLKNHLEETDNISKTIYEKIKYITDTSLEIATDDIPDPLIQFYFKIKFSTVNTNSNENKPQNGPALKIFFAQIHFSSSPILLENLARFQNKRSNCLNPINLSHYLFQQYLATSYKTFPVSLINSDKKTFYDCLHQLVKKYKVLKQEKKIETTAHQLRNLQVLEGLENLYHIHLLEAQDEPLLPHNFIRGLKNSFLNHQQNIQSILLQFKH